MGEQDGDHSIHPHPEDPTGLNESKPCTWKPSSRTAPGLREIHFRLLRAPCGEMLRQLVRCDSHASNISRAITRIRRDFRVALAVPDLAREVGVSVSSFHQHFRDITANTPLQYQKELRLLEARRLLSGGETAVTTVPGRGRCQPRRRTTPEPDETAARPNPSW